MVVPDRLTESKVKRLLATLKVPVTVNGHALMLEPDHSSCRARSWQLLTCLKSGEVMYLEPRRCGDRLEPLESQTVLKPGDHVITVFEIEGSILLSDYDLY